MLSAEQFQRAYIPSNWKEILPIVARHYHWGREEAWRCTLSELFFWYTAMIRDLQPKAKPDALPDDINDFIRQKTQNQSG